MVKAGELCWCSFSALHVSSNWVPPKQNMNHFLTCINFSKTGNLEASRVSNNIDKIRASMLVVPACRVAVFGLWVFLVLAANNCCGENETVEVVGSVECADCVQHNIKTSQAFSGLRVTIDCKSKNGKLKTRGKSELDQEGKFRATLPNYKVADQEDGHKKLKEDCFAQLHSASGAPCAIQNDDKKDSKVVLKPRSANGEKQVLGLNGNMKISPKNCTSAFLWPYFHYPPLPNFPFYSPPPPPQPLPPSIPVYNNQPPPQTTSPPPAPSPAPLYNDPPTPQPPPIPPPMPSYHDPSPPPAPSPAPVYNDPTPTPSPVSQPPLSPPSIEPTASPPVYGNYLPVPPAVPATEKPIPHKSFPQIPKAPPIPRLPPIPSTPRKFFNKPPSPSHA